MNISLKRIWAVALKEYKHILRDPFTLGIALGLPLIFVLFFGFVIDLDYKHIPLNVQDNDKTMYSRRLLQQFTSAGYFDLKPFEGTLETQNLTERNDAAGLLVIKKDFGKNIRAGKQAEAQLLLDGSDNARAAIMLNYSQGIFARAQADFANLSGVQVKQNQAVISRFLFNPELNSRWFIVPALSTIIIGFLAIVLTAVTVAKEWENGSMELLLSTPVLPVEIVLGKLAPYFLLNFFDVMLVFVMALLVFNIPFEGSFILYLVACALYITGALALGLLVSVATRAQQAAIQFAFAVGMLPSFIFSGFIFPIENMPLFFRYLTTLFPQRWFLYISRSLFLSGGDFAGLMIPFACLFAFAAVMILGAVKKFKTDLEP